ncbi:MAG: 2-C-methyl-D-erythritol 4-phosphate cytidylyltransferase [Candidatus Bipolaricaulota bacterium]|nr:2-C-methyl-D-erythritol 4-phosphate cytidylyltransferase [Candidatus Bipolaricaulota bacterium]MBS3791259.1 2-C-methyl-D-erythritol 4-phosphate cytidylyltransferase [Candidatus Bipolaricaulota bacterium]
MGAVILAAGRSSRMGQGVNKVYREILGKPVLTHSIDTFLGSGIVDEMVLVFNEEEEDLLEEKVLGALDRDLSDIIVRRIPGGKKRQDSSRAGVRASETDYVCIHDGARPNFSSDLIVKLLDATVEHGAAFPGVKPVDTIRANNQGYAGATIDRDRHVKVQTPQCFRKDLHLNAINEAVETGRYFTDDAGIVMELGGVRPRVVEGERSNVKITTALDTRLIEVLISS